MPNLPPLAPNLQAREYLYWKLQGVQHTTPVAIMTSAAKGNHWRVQQLFEQAAWFGRGPSSFRLFQQPLVPVVAGEDGRWLLERPLQLMMKPGGHGVIWKLMIDTGVFDWLGAQGRQAAIVRQIRCGGGGVWRVAGCVCGPDQLPDCLVAACLCIHPCPPTQSCLHPACLRPSGPAATRWRAPTTPCWRW